MKKIIFSFAFAFILIILVFQINAFAKTNIALGCNIDSVCCPYGENSPYNLVDRDINLESKWLCPPNASGEPHWITLDFETEKTFDSVRLIKASQGAEDFGRTELNAGGFYFEVSSDKQNWVKITEETDDYSDIFDRSFPPVSARYLKLTVIQPERDENSGETGSVRLYDLKVFEYIPAAENPEIYGGKQAEEPTRAPDVTPDTSDSVYFYLAPLLFLLSAAILSFAVISRKFLNKRI
ncbi:MAG: discoidin domain-containing protein [Oscillospiraceae bacterium]|nr:discoidin domain-containing protein [Oscillospiraceae bacterium]